MDIIADDVLDKTLMFKKKTDAKQPWKTINEIIEDEYFEQYDVKFPKEVLLKCKK